MVRMSAGGSIAPRASQGKHIVWAWFNVFSEKLNHWLPSFAIAFCLPLAVAQLCQAEEAVPPPKPRIVLVEDKSALREFEVNNDRVAEMVTEGMRRLTGRQSEAAAWLSLVTPADTVGIKVNSVPGPIGGTRKAVVDAVVRAHRHGISVPVPLDGQRAPRSARMPLHSMEKSREDSHSTARRAREISSPNAFLLYPEPSPRFHSVNAPPRARHGLACQSSVRSDYSGPL